NLIQELLKDKVLRQVPLTPDHIAYLKICESCFNHCAFCVIPQIKGAFASRTRESLCQEIAFIDERGVKELNIIGQDTTAYGMDLYGKKVLAEMLRDVSRQVQGIHWIRLLYTFPAHVTDELLDVVAQESRICKYIDVPFQHISDSILTRMNRNFSSDQSRALVEKIRKRVPGVRIRSAFIVGLPGEGEQEFEELLDFLRWARFDRAGVFSYSPEEGTPAARMDGQVSEKVKQQRYDQAMALQQKISLELNERMIGNELEVLIEGFDTDQKLYFGRSEFDAPEVDGLVYVRCGRVLNPGTFERVRITDAYEYDLIGEVQ
ncbi:MAG TPA: MiaB/RimO family radical SAM methylthiotransferase, partial [Candidatus Bathyarchaeia archaeon]|nr:MiaB/RimO family radical SAM methylthiotransferase [Candidatus Bathyarchaeia archaeon]